MVTRGVLMLTASVCCAVPQMKKVLYSCAARMKRQESPTLALTDSINVIAHAKVPLVRAARAHHVSPPGGRCSEGPRAC